MNATHRGKNLFCTARGRVLARREARFFQESFAQALRGRCNCRSDRRYQRSSGLIAAVTAIEPFPPTFFRAPEPAAAGLASTLRKRPAEIFRRLGDNQDRGEHHNEPCDAES